MQNSNQFLLDRRNPIQVGDEFSARQVRGVITLVPNEANATRHLANSPSSGTYRQELRMVVAAPVVERRVSYAGAGMMGASQEGRLTNRMITEILVASGLILLLFLVAAATGILIGAVIGQVVVPADLLTPMLFAAVGLSIFLLGVGLGVGLGS